MPQNKEKLSKKVSDKISQVGQKISSAKEKLAENLKDTAKRKDYSSKK